MRYCFHHLTGEKIDAQTSNLPKVIWPNSRARRHSSFIWLLSSLHLDSVLYTWFLNLALHRLQHYVHLVHLFQISVFLFVSLFFLVTVIIGILKARNMPVTDWKVPPSGKGSMISESCLAHCHKIYHAVAHSSQSQVLDSPCKSSISSVNPVTYFILMHTN